MAASSAAVLVKTPRWRRRRVRSANQPSTRLSQDTLVGVKCRRQRGLLVRRSLSDGSLAYFTTWCPAGTPIQELVAVEGRRWAIEDAFETAKTELGLAHNETRSWHGWHRHVSLVMLAFAMLARVRQLANGPPPKTTLIAKLAGALVDPGNPARSDPPGATAH